MGKSWPFEHIETLKELVRMGLSQGEIGLAMGISASAAAGKIQRLRKTINDDTLRAGLTSGRIGKSHDGGYHRLKKRTPEEIRAASSARWELWRSTHSRNGGSVVSAIQAAERRAKMRLKEMRRQAMLDLKDFPNAVHLIDRLMNQCPWPLWGEDAPYSEKMMCGNPSETWGHYCSAHMCQAHDVRQRGAFMMDKGRTANKWTTNTVQKRGEWNVTKPNWAMRGAA